MKSFIKRVVLLAIACALLIPPSSLAASVINYWYSDKNYVSYMPYDGSYYVTNYSSNATYTSQFNDAIAHARTQWNAVLPIGITQTSANHAISYVYGGTRDQLLGVFPSLGTNQSGLTTVEKQDGNTKYVDYQGSRKTVYMCSAANKMCVVQRYNASANNYKKTAMHEMGHLFGWNGHSLQDSDVMYGNNSAVTALTSRDKNHIKQIYNLFY